MRKFLLAALAAGLAGLGVHAADWPNQGGNPQHDGWAKAEKSFTKENAHSIELLYKYKADNQARGPQALTTPLINGNLISYLGFKEMLVLGGSSDNVYAVDADLNRLFWKGHFEYKGDKPQAAATNLCPGGITAPLAMPGSSTGGAGRGAGGRGAGRAGTQPQPVNVRPPTPPGPRQQLFMAGFGRAGVFAVVTGDGYLHALNTSLGTDKIAPIPFLPGNSKTNGLNVDNGTIYAATVDGCGGNANTLYAIDMLADDVTVASFPTNGIGLTGTAGTSLGLDGTVFAQAPDGHGETAGEYNDTVLALTAKTLKVRDYFTPSGKGGKKTTAVATPMFFQHKGKDYVVSSGSDGRLYLLNAAALGGADHHTPLFATGAAGAAPTGFASAEDADGTRWIYASLPTGISAYKVEGGDTPMLTAAWKSREMIAPAPAVLANGLVFALSSGDRQKHAVLYALDGVTGKELYNSGDAAATFAHGSGLAIANSRIYFSTHDNVAYCFGFSAEQPQLTGK